MSEERTHETKRGSEAEGAPPGEQPLAIVGLGAMFPGARDVQEFWANVRDGVDSIREVPESHWSPEDFHDPDPQRADFTYGRRGGFLDPALFDPREFGVSPRDIASTDTTQLLGMAVARAALIDAGYEAQAGDGVGRPFDRSRTSVILGVTGALELVVPLGARLGHPHWRRALADAGVDQQTAERVVEGISNAYVPWTESSFPGLLGNVAAGRIAGRLDLHGTNCVVDAACASSLAALHLAALELQAGRSDLVLAGGLDTFNDIFMYMCFSKTPALSPSGDARPFDRDGDGTILGEGLGVLALRRLEDARRHGDRIYAVLRGIGTSSDGRGVAVYEPSSSGQARALRDAYRRTGLSPTSIDLLEAHGTGTRVGDATEVRALTEVYREAGEGAWCTIGSVKANIGHTKAAAGAAGLMKAVLALHHQVLPPTIKVGEVNEALVDSPFQTREVAAPWSRPDGHPRRAAVSSFGFGGTNFHCVIEEAPAEARAAQAEVDLLGLSRSVQLFAWSAPTGHDLQRLVGQGVDRILGAGIDWNALRRIARENRRDFDGSASHRLSCVIERPLTQNAGELQRFLEMVRRSAAGGETPPNVPIYVGSGTPAGDAVLLFPGQGAQQLDMLAGWMTGLPCARRAFLEADRQMRARCGQSLVEAIYPPRAAGAELREERQRSLTATATAQPALGAVGAAVWRVLEQVGLSVRSAIGHSFGELTALHASGRFDQMELLRLARRRGELMAGGGAGDLGSMFAVLGQVAEVEDFLRSSGSRCVVANHNSPRQVVVAGPTADLGRAKALLEDRGLVCRPLQVAAAFHTDLVAHASEPFARVISEQRWSAGRFEVISNVTGSPYPESPEAAQPLLARQLASPVRFRGGVESLLGQGASVFLEMGPGRRLGGLVREIAANAEADVQVLALDRGGRAESDLAGALAALSAAGVRWNVSSWDGDEEIAETPRFAVRISGANQRPEAPSAPKAPSVDHSPVPTAPVAGGQDLVPAAAEVPPIPVVSLIESPSEALTMTSNDLETKTSIDGEAPAATEGDAARVAGPVEGWLGQGISALLELQQRTADAHQAFLESQHEASERLERLLAAAALPAASAAQLPVGGESGGFRPEALRGSVPAPGLSSDSTETPEHEMQIGSVESAASTASAQTPPAPREEAVAATPAAAVEASVVRQPLPAQATSHAAPPVGPEEDDDSVRLSAEPAGVVASDLQELVLSVLAERTGYPSEMLEPTMELDADLGIDSIKRVEILAALQDALPGVSVPEPEELAQLLTVSDVAEALGASSSPGGVSGVAPHAEGGTTPRGRESIATDAGPQISAADSLDGVQVPSSDVSSGADGAPLSAAGLEDPQTERVVLEIVAERTGYPVEMLDLSMELDADLGIDSIKRVEILAALQERLPGVEVPEPDELAQLNTLAEVSAVLHAPGAADQGGMASPAADLAVPTAEGGPGQVVAAQASGTEPAPGAQQALLQIVAERTGYPLEMLDPTMELDADLGIDSIKRVEILSALAEIFPDAVLPEPDELAQLSTLEEVARQLDLAMAPTPTTGSELAEATAVGAGSSERPQPVAVQAGKEPGPSAAEVGTPAEERREEVVSERLDRYVLQLESLDPPAGHVLLNGGRRIWIVGPDEVLATRLAQELEQRGHVAETIDIHTKRPVPADLAGLVVLGPRGVEGTAGDRFVRESLEWIQRAAPALRNSGSNEGNALLAGIVRLDGSFGAGSGRELHGVEEAGLAGLIKTAHHEWPEVSTRIVDWSPELSDDAGEIVSLVDELLRTGPIEIGLGAHGRTTPRLVAQELRATKPSFAAEDLYVVTGGARGVTAEVALELARRGVRRFVLLGRTDVERAEPRETVGLEGEAEIKRALAEATGIRSPRELARAYRRLVDAREARANLARLRSLGVEVAYRSVDLTDAEALQGRVLEIVGQFGPVTGLVHGAGVLADRLIVDKTLEDFDRVYSTKVEGLRNLLHALAGHPLRVLALFSSTTARFGRSGQADYAAANEVLNKIAAREARRRSDCRVVSFGWGPWDGGMVDDSLRALFAEEGVELIGREAGAAAFVEEIGAPGASEVVLLGPGSRLPSTVTIEAEPLPAAQPESTSDRSVAMRRELSVEGDAYLTSHVLDGHAVVPAAVMMDWLANAALHAQPGRIVRRLRDFRVLKGIRLTKERIAIEAVYGAARPTEEGVSLAVEIRTLDGRGGYRVRASAVAEVVDELPAEHADAQPETGEASALKVDEVYQRYLFHGPKLRPIEAIEDCSPRGVRGLVHRAPAPSSWMEHPVRGRWLIDPFLIDGAFQLMIVWSQRHRRSPSLPAYLESYEQFAAVEAEPLVEIRCRIVDEGTNRARADIDFVSGGQLVARMVGYESVIDASLHQPFRHNSIDGVHLG